MSSIHAWQAAFITPADHDGAPGAAAPYLRTEFTVSDGLQRATLRVTALGLVEAHLNGTIVGDEVLTPGWTSYRHRLVVSTHDVTAHVLAGANAFGAVVGEGWAVGRLGWDHRRHLWANRPAAFMQLELDYGDRVEIVATDETWRAGRGGVLANSLYDGEHFDARAEPDAWDRAGFDDSDWDDVAIVPWDVATLVEPVAPPIRRIEERSPVAVITTPGGRTVVDFGQVLTGWVRLRVDGDAGTTITLHHCETLIDGEPEYETNRTAEATDRYTLRGGETEIWEPRFTFHGFRYVDVDGWPGALAAEDLTAVVIHSDMRRTGWFECSDDMLNQLHQNIVWSMRGNFVGVPTDCPQRDERLGWTGDINAFGPTAAYLYDCSGVLESWLADVAAEQAEIGVVPAVVPDIGLNLKTPTALWGDVVISLPMCLYEAYGDLELVRRHYPSMTEYLAGVEPMLDERGVWSRGFQFGDWVDPDAPAGNPGAAKADRHLVATAFLVKTTGEVARAAELIGSVDDAARYRALNERVRNGFRSQWVTPSGLIADLSATAYALAICFGCLDDDQLPAAGARLAKLVRKAGHRISTGFAGTPYVTEALTRTGHLDVAYALLLETSCPSFLYPITMGATTVWERWDAIRPDGTLHRTGMTSLNHYALGAIATWLHQTVAGLAPGAPGYDRLRVAPRPGGGLTRAAATLDTVRGRARVAWESIGGEFTLDLEVPPGASAEVTLPDHPDGLVVGVEAGTHHWRYPIAVVEAPKLTLDATFADLRAHPDVFESVRASVRRHLDIDVDTLEMSLRMAIGWASGASPALSDELRRALAPVLGG